ncbi:hypothetical protein H9P43_006260 [Blastocladiella emersonii ATCC 22665]|nr:hypothetical protein H9P43_006260 [Blastocladiella emersonii ATCC 22665]
MSTSKPSGTRQGSGGRARPGSSTGRSASTNNGSNAGGASGSGAQGKGKGGAAGTAAATASTTTAAPGGHGETKPSTNPAGSTSRRARGGGGMVMEEAVPEEAYGDGGECIPLLDVFVHADFLGELDALAAVPDVPWTVEPRGIIGSAPPRKKAGAPAVKSDAAAAAADPLEAQAVLAEAEREIALMASDLRDKHLVQFHHANWQWCKEQSMTREQTSVVLGLGKLLMDRVQATLPKSALTDPTAATPATPAANEKPSSTGSTASMKTTKSSTVMNKKAGAAAAGGTASAPASLAANMAVIPVEHLQPVLDTYMVRELAYHTATVAGVTGSAAAVAEGAGAAGNGSGNKWQVLTAAQADAVAAYFRESFLNHLRLIRLAYTVPRRYERVPGSSRPSSAGSATCFTTAAGGIEVFDEGLGAILSVVNTSRPATTSGSSPLHPAVRGWGDRGELSDDLDSDSEDDDVASTTSPTPHGARVSSAGARVYTASPATSSVGPSSRASSARPHVPVPVLAASVAIETDRALAAAVTGGPARV